MNNGCGEVIGGEVEKLIIRQKSDSPIELGDLLIQERDDASSLLLQVFDLAYGSQISQLSREMISGIRLEGLGAGLDLVEPNLRNYVMAAAKSVLHIGQKLNNPKILPNIFGQVRHVTDNDLNFLNKPENSLFLGYVRSGSKILKTPVHLDGPQVLAHHILVPATTGRGKSNLIKVILWNVLDNPSCGFLVLDAHNEYSGMGSMKGLRDHPKSNEYLRYYSVDNSIPGTFSLMINLRSLLPVHFRGIVDFSDAQKEAIALYYNEFSENWIEQIVSGEETVSGVKDTTIAVLRRKFENVLGVYFDYQDQEMKFRMPLFSNSSGESTIKEIIDELEKGKIVIVDTSLLDDQAELLIGSVIAQGALYRYKRAKEQDRLKEKPTISIVIEEAPRVLSNEVLSSSGSNIYSDIAREGRKFKVGLVAITQLTSVIPKTILANMNTKIILGNELSSERASIIQSASQDLTTDDKNIASLDKGEAIISSNFTRFAVPIKIPLFEDLVTNSGNKKSSVSAKRVRVVT